MSVPHHSEEEFQKQRRFIEQVLRTSSPRFPQGKIGPNDEGELAFAIAVDRKAELLRIEFGKPVSWLAFPIEEAMQLHRLLGEKIQELKNPAPSRD